VTSAVTNKSTDREGGGSRKVTQHHCLAGESYLWGEKGVGVLSFM
jgi:hypothetical protein